MDIGIVYFSGTGNTEILAEEIHDSMESQEHRARLMEMEEILQGRSGFHPADYRIIGIGFPVHGMNPARIALDFIHRMPAWFFPRLISPAGIPFCYRRRNKPGK